MGLLALPTCILPLTIAMQTGTSPIEPLPTEERLVPVPSTRVRLADDAFFAPWVRRNREVTLFFGHEQLEKNGQFKNFRLAAGSEKGDYCGVHFYDSDAYKWLEAASLSLAQNPDPRLVDLVDRFIVEIAAAQEPDGYLQTQYSFKKQERWSRLPDDHELYCAGHLIQAAIAHHEVTGKRTLYDVALKLANCIDSTFGPGKRPGCCGHPEIETALVQLYRHSGEKRWLDLAKFFLDERGQKPPLAGGDFYRQDDKPVRAQTAAAGHAVRQLYLCSGMVGVAAETSDRGLFDAALAISRDIDACKLYVTGGIGARQDGEAFGQPFELPNQSAYAETCASIALMRFSEEMLALTGKASFADRVENTLYNAFLASIGADGKSFFYVNPLESTGGKQRQPWFWCACCPPNIMRTFAGLTGWFASTTKDTLYLHLFDDVTIDAKLGDGREVGLSVATDYPRSGHVEITFTKVPEGSFVLAVRCPGWANGRSATTRVGLHTGLETGNGYWIFTDRFKVGTTIAVDFPLGVEFMRADPRVAEDRGKVALRCGPLVYAFESSDQADVDLFATGIDPASVRRGTGRPMAEQDFVPIACRGTQTRVSDDPAAPEKDALYRPAPAEGFVSRNVELTAIPYYSWANRGDSKMRIWMPLVTTALAAAASTGSGTTASGQVPVGAPRPESTFGADVKFLQDNADAIVLRAAGGGPIVVSPKLTSRVMTSSFTEGEVGFGLVNREAISKPPIQRGFNNYGGEDRLWFAPEGGPWGLYFDPGAQQELENWYVPLAMDGGPRTVAAQDASSVTFRDRVQVSNVKKVAFDVAVERRIEALARTDVEKLLGRPLPENVKLVAFRSTNTLTNESKAPLSPEDALLAPWVLGQMKPSAKNEVLLPFRGQTDVVKKDYFGEVPEYRLKLLLTAATDGGVARFQADSELRSKIGVDAKASLGWVGAYDRVRNTLTLVNHTLPEPGAVVPDCNWIDPNPRARAGDVTTSYNHGQEPRFFELESIGSAMPVAPKGSVTHVQTTIHLGGDPAMLARLCRQFLRADP